MERKKEDREKRIDMYVCIGRMPTDESLDGCMYTREEKERRREMRRDVL